MKCVSTLATAVFVLVAPVTWATTDDVVRLQPKWQALDKNGDGKITLDELHPLQAQAMSRSDSNHDGAISLTEYVSYDLDPGASAGMPLADNVVLKSDIAYADNDDPRQQLDIYLPKKSALDGPLPVVIYVHGGGWQVGSKVMAKPQVMPLVNSGRVAAVSVGYRLSWQQSWPAQIHDVKAAVRWVRAHASEFGLDGSRICAMGASAGGHLVAMLGTTNQDKALEGTVGPNLDQSSAVQCVIDFFGPADLAKGLEGSMGDQDPVAALLGRDPVQRQKNALEASPLNHVDSSDVPFLIIHGTKDPLVSYQDSVKLTQALKKAGVPVLFQTIEGGGHGDFYTLFGEINQRVAAYLEQQFFDPTVKVPTNLLVNAPVMNKP